MSYKPDNRLKRGRSTKRHHRKRERIKMATTTSNQSSTKRSYKKTESKSTKLWNAADRKKFLKVVKEHTTVKATSNSSEVNWTALMKKVPYKSYSKSSLKAVVKKHEADIVKAIDRQKRKAEEGAQEAQVPQVAGVEAAHDAQAASIEVPQVAGVKAAQVARVEAAHATTTTEDVLVQLATKQDAQSHASVQEQLRDDKSECERLRHLLKAKDQEITSLQEQQSELRNAAQEERVKREAAEKKLEVPHDQATADCIEYLKRQIEELLEECATYSDAHHAEASIVTKRDTYIEYANAEWRACFDELMVLRKDLRVVQEELADTKAKAIDIGARNEELVRRLNDARASTDQAIEDAEQRGRAAAQDTIDMLKSELQIRESKLEMLDWCTANYSKLQEITMTHLGISKEQVRGMKETFFEVRAKLIR